jgi:hypothetical protein
MSKKIQKNVLLIGVFVGLGSVIKAQKIKTVTVNSGHIFFRGKYISPPYTITLKQGPIVYDICPADTVFVNGIPFKPYKIEIKRDLPPLPKTKEEMEARRKEIREMVKKRVGEKKIRKEARKIFRPIIDSLRKLIKAYKGTGFLFSYVKEFLDNHPNLTEWEMSESVLWPKEVYVKYKGYTYLSNYGGLSFYLSGENDPTGARITTEEIIQLRREQKEKYFNRLVTLLKEGGVYGDFKEGVILVPSDKAEKWLSRIKSVLNQSIPDSLKEKQIAEIVIHELMAQVIVENHKEWEKVKVKKEEK